jgi:hypothetical protein
MNNNNNNSSYIKTDDNKVLNEKYIRWIRKMNECLEVCTKSDGCNSINTHKICKMNSLDSYNKLNKYFE